MGDFLTSGRVLFNDEASAYLAEILDVLLVDNPELRKQLRIYVVKSAAVNAFATNNGIIFMTVGMLARMENEAQLAWVLSHEIIHFREQHVINSYVKGQEIKQSKGMYKKLSLDEKDYAKSSFNKEQETESDTEGLKLFLRTDYKKAEALKVFDILAQAHLPERDKAFSAAYFETKNFVLPAKLKLDTVKQRSIHDDYDDTKSSHPKLKKRKEEAAALIKNAPAGFADSSLIKHYIGTNGLKQLDEVSEYIDKLASQHSSLLDNLLSWSVIQQGEFPYTPEKLFLNPLLDENKAIFQTMAHAKNIHLETFIDEEIYLWADSNCVLTILRNLTSNALKFTPEGGTVTVSAEQRYGFAEIQVADTGIGMPADRLETLFTLREEKRTWGTSGEKGLGIGLRLAYDFAEMNKGSIGVSSREGHGTTFVIRIPLYTTKSLTRTTHRPVASKSNR